MKKNIGIIVFISFMSSATAQFVVKQDYKDEKRTYIDDASWAPREHYVDFIHMRLQVSFDCKAGLVKGKVTHTFKPLRENVDSIYLDGPGIKILSATLNGKVVKTLSDNQGIWLFTGKTLHPNELDSISLVYEVSPRKGLYFIGWNDPAGICRKQIWTQGQGIDNRNWIPCYDEMNDKITTDMIVVMDGAYKVLSNGNKISEKLNKDGTKTWHYQLLKPYAPYLIMLGIGDYAILDTKSKSGVPLHLYYYPEWKDRVPVTYQYSEQMIDFFEKEIGVNYPWSSYSQIPVQEFMYGAMENVTATVFGDFLFVDERGNLDRGYVGVNAHELAHQWFGDFVTAKSDAHHWLQESFATYYDALFERSVYGEDHFNWQRRNDQNSALSEALKNDFPIAHSQAGSTRHYPKGSFVLNMLKYVVGGREAYNRGVKNYLDKHAYGNVISEDLLSSFEETTGMDLHWFWEQWVYHGGEPSYNVGAEEITVAGVRVTRFTVEQIQQQKDVVPLFKMPIWFEVHYVDGTVDLIQKWIIDKKQIVDVPNTAGKPIAFVLFDPNNEILKNVKFDKSIEWLKNQALNSPTMLDRYDALVALDLFAIELKRETLKKSFAQEKFHALKSEVIRQLITDIDSKEIINAAINSNDVYLQKSVINNTNIILPDMLVEYEKLVGSSSYDVVATTLDKLAFQYPQNTIKYLELTKGVIGTAGRNVEIKWLEVKAKAALDRDAIEKLVAYTSVSYEFRTRVNAAQALKRLNFFNDFLLTNLSNAMFSANSRLANPCSAVLNHFYNQSVYRKKIADFSTLSTWEAWQLTIFKNTLK